MKATDLLRALDTHANRPAATAVPKGALYPCSTHGKVYQSDGTTWADWNPFGAGGITVQEEGTTVASGVVQLDVYGAAITAAAGSSEATLTVVEREVIMVAVSDEATAITTGTAKVTFRMPFAMTLTAVRASLTVASTSGNPAIDINESGTSVLSTTLTIDATEKTSTTAATPAVISDANLADDAEITIDIDTAGTGAKGLKVYLIGTRT
jgi:hypothetical protein